MSIKISRFVGYLALSPVASMEKVAGVLTDSSSLSTGDRVISIRYGGTISSHQMYSNASALQGF